MLQRPALRIGEEAFAGVLRSSRPGDGGAVVVVPPPVNTLPVNALLKITIALVAVALLAVLFVRSARNAGSQPFTIARPDLSGWRLAIAPADDPLGSLLSITPKMELMRPLTRDLFARMGESLHYPQAAMPVVLRVEFDRAMAGVLTPEGLLEAARSAGIESLTFQPRCMARRRVSAPGVVRGVYFLLFDLPQLTRFREQLAQQLRAAGGDASLFDPAALSPVVLAAALDGNFGSWLPLRADPDVDCFAPVIVE